MDESPIQTAYFTSKTGDRFKQIDILHRMLPRTVLARRHLADPLFFESSHNLINDSILYHVLKDFLRRVLVNE